MKIAVLWTHFSGYLSACLRALAERPGIELFVSFQSNSKEAPYADSTSSWISRRYIYDETPGERLLELLQEFQPDVMLVTSWHVNRYRAACRQFSHALRVCCMDNQCPRSSSLRIRSTETSSSPVRERGMSGAAQPV